MKYKLLVTLYTFIIVSFLQGCSHNNSGYSIQVISVNLDDAVSLRDAVGGMEILVLNDSLSEHFPGELSKVEWDGDSIFVLDSWRDPGVYVYNSDGDLLGSYTRKGAGPNEFLGLCDMEITPSEIILLDTYSNSNRIYLDRQLTFLQKKTAEEQAAHFMVIGDGKSVWYDRGNIAYGENRDKLLYVSENNRTAVLPVPQDIENVTFACRNVFSKVAQDTILYLPSLEPRIYRCSQGVADVFCEFDFNGAWPKFPKGIDKSNPLELMHRIVKEGKVYTTNMLSDGKEIAFTFYCSEDFYIQMIRYDDLYPRRLLKVDSATMETLGSLVSLKDGSLVFGEPGKLLVLRLK